jgi:hypothetical protein
VVGLSVDYCLHVVHSYSHARVKSKHATLSERAQRVRAALVSIGPSIIGASATTIGSMIVLMFATIHIFVVIGIVVSVTLAMGIIFALGTLTSILTLVGPQGNDGNIVHWARCIAAATCAPWLYDQHQNNNDHVPLSNGVDSSSSLPIPLSSSPSSTNRLVVTTSSSSSSSVVGARQPFLQMNDTPNNSKDMNESLSEVEMRPINISHGTPVMIDDNDHDI